jgi:hypothetical protein
LNELWTEPSFWRRCVEAIPTEGKMYDVIEGNKGDILKAMALNA